MTPLSSSPHSERSWFGGQCCQNVSVGLITSATCCLRLRESALLDNYLCFSHQSYSSEMAPVCVFLGLSEGLHNRLVIHEPRVVSSQPMVL